MGRAADTRLPCHNQADDDSGLIRPGQHHFHTHSLMVSHLTGYMEWVLAAEGTQPHVAGEEVNDYQYIAEERITVGTIINQVHLRHCTAKQSRNRMGSWG
jgi:hypothetical protein